MMITKKILKMRESDEKGKEDNEKSKRRNEKEDGK